MDSNNSTPDEVDWNVTRLAVALHQFQHRYQPEVRAALQGERLDLDNQETTNKVRSVVAEICDRDRLCIPAEVLHSLISNFITGLAAEEGNEQKSA